ncbi:flavodoxin-dependent (E)-4-hydroxy-3-methylbut-2-enyl-diphosphate synthase, partial [bacterium]|nr:flavodoxin-dependent (E)-4-hydroxy-3-methylbut-2-enyl-diphosphate synthase [bacterium]
AVGIGALLLDGIGDTIRVSLTYDPIEEVRVGYEILSSLGLRQKKTPELLCCPTCGRCSVDLIPIANKVEEALQGCDPKLKVAVMGCVVNGPGEAKEADLGIAWGSENCALIFKKGQKDRKIEGSVEKIVKEFVKEVRSTIDEGRRTKNQIC